MLGLLRKKTKLIISAIIILIVPAFVLWGVSSAVSRKSSYYAGKIFNEKISVRDYNDAFQGCQLNALMLYGDNYNQVSQYLNLNQQAWERLILLNQAKKQGIKVIDQELIQHIESFPFFQDNGKFSKQRYYYILAGAFRMTPEKFEQLEKQNLLIAKLISQVTSSVYLSDADFFNAYKQEKEQIKIQYVLIPASEFENTIKITDDQALEFYKNNPNLFKQPEQRQIQYIKIPFAQFVAEVSDDELQAFYEKNKILFKNQTEDKTAEPTYKSFDEVKNVILSTIKINKQKEQAYKLADQITENLLDKQPFADIAKKNNLNLLESPLFLKNTRDISGVSAQDTPILINETFNINLGDTSDIIEGIDGFYILKVTNIQENFIPAFEEIKNAVLEEAKKELSLKQSFTAAQNSREQVLGLIKNGSPFKQAAEQSNLTVIETEPFSINDSIKGIGFSKEISQAAVELEINQLSNVISIDTGSIFFTPISKTSPNLDDYKNDKNIEQFKSFVLNKKKNMIYSTWFTDLKNKANLMINEKIFEQPNPKGKKQKQEVEIPADDF